MADTQRQNPTQLDWSGGSNNLTSRDRQPQGTVRELVNLDPMNGGKLSLRGDGRRVLDLTNVRGVLSLGTRVLIAAGASLVEFDTVTAGSRVLRTIDGAGPFVGDVVNEKLYFCTASESLEYDGAMVRPWGVRDVTIQPPVTTTTGGILPGNYKVAVTLVDQWGREGGTDKAVIRSLTTGGLVIGPVSVPAGHTANVYVGSNHGSELYLQATVSDGQSATVTQVRDDTQRCNTEFARAPKPGHIVRYLNGVLTIANGNVVQLTKPFQPHLVDRLRGYIQFPSKVGEVLADGALYVSADKCYRIPNAETRDVSQKVVLEFPAIPGTGVLLPSGRAAWMTPYGEAVTTPEGMQLMHRESYAGGYGSYGSAGVLDYNGNQLIITVMRGRKLTNPLAVKEINTP